MAVYRNPKIYVTTPPPTPWDRLQRAKRIGAAIFVGIFTIGLFWLLFFSPVFAVSELLVEGPASQEMKERFNEFIGKNIFRLNSDRLEQELRTQYPYIKSIAVYRGLPNALKIEVATRKEALVWESGGREFLVDFEGIPFAEVTNPFQGISENPFPELPFISDTRAAPVTLGSPLLRAEFVDFSGTIFREFQGVVGMGFTALRVGETTFHLEVVTDQGFSVFLDTTRRADRQLAALKTLLDSHRDKVKEYVDLRIAGKAYVK